MGRTKAGRSQSHWLVMVEGTFGLNPFMIRLNTRLLVQLSPYPPRYLCLPCQPWRIPALQLAPSWERLHIIPSHMLPVSTRTHAYGPQHSHSHSHTPSHFIHTGAFFLMVFVFYFSHADGFVRSLAGPPHYFRSGTASRKLEQQMSVENVTVLPAEGANGNTVVSTTVIRKTEL